MPSPTDALLQALAANDFAAMETCARQLIASRPDYAPAWRALGVAELRRNRIDTAIEAFNRAVSLGGDGASLRFELASALEKAGRWDEAVAHLRHAAVLEPQSSEAHINLTALLEKLDLTDEALQYGQQAVALDPDNPVAHFNLATVLQSMGQLDAAISAYTKCTQLDKNFALGYANRGACRLLMGCYDDGWSDYEWRLRTGKVEVTPFAQPRWEGQSLADGTLLVHGEQGVGDEIFFASCVPELVLTVGKCALACDPRLAKLLARSFPAVTIVAHSRQAGGLPPQLPFTVTAQISSGSLPKYLRPRIESFPSRKRFLVADPAERRKWRSRLDSAGAGLKVGISWRGGGSWEERRRRTSNLDQWRELLGTPGVQFINLQYGDCADELATAAKRLGVTVHNFDEANPLGDLDAFAGKIAALDLVISIGNANVHLAGALGISTWCLLPFVPQWRWGMAGETTPWYPSVRLIRQTVRGDWTQPLAEAAIRLRELVDHSKVSATCEWSNARARSDDVGAVAVSPTPPMVTNPRTSNPADMAGLLKQAIELFNKSRFEEAAPLAEQVLSADPESIHALRILGVAARKDQQFDRAFELLDRAARLAPENPALHFEKGVVCMEQSRQREAYECFLRTVKANPNFQPAYVNISAILEQQERFEEAMQWAKKAAEIRQDCPLAHYNLANTLRECGRVADAIAHYERSAELNPDYVKARWNLGICRVLLGRFAEAWPHFELREVAEEVKIDCYTQPRWDGSPLAGKSIVIHAEQGIGDEVLFASCFDDVIRQAGKTILVCEPRLAKLFARSFPAATVHGWARRKDWSPMPLTDPIDYQTPAGSLPLYLRNTPESFPKREAFLIPDAATVDRWRSRFAQLGGGLKVGISWRAGGKANEGRKRTIPLPDWREVLQTPGVEFINLQYSDASDDLAEVERELGVTVHDWEQGDPLVDMDSYAAKIAALDVVISVGNAAVHLAGAVGTTAWTMLPRVPSWRWMVTGEVSPWYSSVRLFRQPRRREWAPVLAQIAERLREVAKLKTSGEDSEKIAKQIHAVMPLNEPAETALVNPPSDIVDEWLDSNELGNRQPLKVIEQLQQQAEAAMSAQNFSEAEKFYREILSVTPRHLKAHAGLGLIGRATGRTDLAIRSFRRALNQYEPHSANHAQLAGALVDAGRADEALIHAKRAASLDPKAALAHLELGRALQLAEQHVAAIEAFNWALQLSPGEAEAIAALSRSLVLTCRIDEAIRMLRKATQRAPRHPQLLLALGRALFEDQCFDDAERTIREAIAANPCFEEAHSALAELLRERETALSAEMQPTFRVDRPVGVASPYTQQSSPQPKDSQFRM